MVQEVFSHKLLLLARDPKEMEQKNSEHNNLACENLKESRMKPGTLARDLDSLTHSNHSVPEIMNMYSLLRILNRLSPRHDLEESRAG
jgi:hypothetical protein